MSALTPAQRDRLRAALDYWGLAGHVADDVIERMASGDPERDDESGVRPPDDDSEMPDDPTAQDAYFADCNHRPTSKPDYLLENVRYCGACHAKVDQ